MKKGFFILLLFIYSVVSLNAADCEKVFEDFLKKNSIEKDFFQFEDFADIQNKAKKDFPVDYKCIINKHPNNPNKDI